MDQEYQRAVTRICVETALLLLQHGAESAVVVQMAQRLGVALGIESVECALTANAVLLTTLSKQHCITTVRKNVDKGINMQIVTDVQHIVVAVEHHLYDLTMAQNKLDKLKPLKYNRYLVVFMIGLSCASLLTFLAEISQFVQSPLLPLPLPCLFDKKFLNVITIHSSSLPLPHLLPH